MYAIGHAAVERESFAHLRDWLPLVYVLVAYRQMDWFTPAVRDHHFENSWIGWGSGASRPMGPAPRHRKSRLADPRLLGVLLPPGLWHRRDLARLPLLGEPPRPGGFIPVRLRDRHTNGVRHVPVLPLGPAPRRLRRTRRTRRHCHLAHDQPYLVGNLGIHSSVFPSAHVSSGFAAGWGLVRFLPERPWIGQGDVDLCGFSLRCHDLWPISLCRRCSRRRCRRTACARIDRRDYGPAGASGANSPASASSIGATVAVRKPLHFLNEFGRLGHLKVNAQQDQMQRKALEGRGTHLEEAALPVHGLDRPRNGGRRSAIASAGASTRTRARQGGASRRPSIRMRPGRGREDRVVRIADP